VSSIPNDLKSNGLRDIVHVHNKSLIDPDSNGPHATLRDLNDSDCADGTPHDFSFQREQYEPQTPTDGHNTDIAYSL